MTKISDLFSNAGSAGGLNTALSSFSDSDTGTSGTTYSVGSAGAALVTPDTSGEPSPVSYSNAALNLDDAALVTVPTASGSGTTMLAAAPAGDPDWKGDEAIGVPQLTDSIPTANAKMYAQVDAELDAILGKGQYTKPQGHYQYVKTIGEAMKQLSPEQQVAFKNRLEQIGQPLHINFGLTRTRNDNGALTGVPLNSYAQNPFSSAQQVEEMRLKQEFFDQRDAALGRVVAR